MSQKICHKRHRKQWKYGEFCKGYNKDQICEFRHFHYSEDVDNLLADNEELFDEFEEMEYGSDKNISMNNKKSKRLKENLRNSEERVLLLRLDTTKL